MATGRATYGIDAPVVVRRLAIAGTVLILVGLFVPGFLRASNPDLAALVTRIGIAWGSGFLLGALVMLWSSLFGKFIVRDRLLNAVALKGDERVLDVGCGRGQVLIGAAKRLTTGRAIGLDLWSANDLSGNSASETLTNAVIEGVSDRVGVETGDMCAMPFGDKLFDVVLSMTAIHNVPAANRDKALLEIARVLKPGGRVAIFDIAHTGRYAKLLRGQGFEVRRSWPVPLWFSLGGRCLYGRKKG